MLPVPYISQNLFSDGIYMKLFRIKLLVLLVLLLAANGADCAESKQNTEARRCLAHVDSLLLENRLPEAISVALGYQQKYLDNSYWQPVFDGRLGVALLRSDRPEEALPLLEAQVVADPAVALAHRNLGACLLAMGRRGRALSEYQQVVELDPRNAHARLEYGQVLLDFRINEDAGRELLMAAGLCNDCPEVQPALGRYYMAVNQPAEAAPYWEAVWTATANPVARQNYLKALLDSGQDAAALDFLSSLPMDGLSGVELQQMAAAEGRLGIIEQSLRFAHFLDDKSSGEEVLLKVGGDPLFWALVSLNLLKAEHFSESMAAVEKALSLDPENIVYLNNRVVLLQKLGLQEDAVREWEKIQAMDSSREGK